MAAEFCVSLRWSPADFQARQLLQMVFISGRKQWRIRALKMAAKRTCQIPEVHVLQIIKQLLDEVFVISRTSKVEVGVISRSRRLRRLVTLTETLIILDITETEYII